MKREDTPEPRRLRIAVLNRAFVSTGGGAERYSIALVEALAPNHEIHVFAQTIDHSVPGVQFHHLPGAVRRPRWLNQLVFAFTSWRATRHGFDIVHSHEMTWHGNVQTVHVLPVRYNLLEGRSGAARIWRMLKIFTSPRLLSYWLLEAARFKTSAGRVFVATSDQVRHILLRTYPHIQSHLVVVPPGVDQVTGVATPAESRTARERFGLPLHGRCVLFVANDFRKKGLPAVLDAVQRLAPDIYLCVAGGAGHIPEFQAMVESLRLTGRVFFVGAVTDMSLLYAAADALVHPTLEDTFAMVVLEAMSHGLPVVVSGAQYCGISGLLQDRLNALILKNPRDGAEIAAQLGAVLKAGAQRDELQSQALAFAGAHLWAEIAQTQARIYGQVASTGPHRP